MVPTADIRKFLTELFNDEELTTLCYDYFRDVYDDFALGMSKGQKIQRLIERCDHREAIPNLLAALAAERAAQYDARFGALVEAVVPAAEQPRDGRDPRQVFISRAHEDAEFAHRLAADLRTRGWRVWIAPDSILPGEKWVDAIERGLAASGVFVVVLTPAAIRSRWVKTETNAAIALEHREAMRLVPLDVAACAAPVLWSSYQFISFRSRYEDGLRGLLSWLDPPQMSSPPPPPVPVQTPAAADPRGADAAQPARRTVPAVPQPAGAAPPQPTARALPGLLTLESPIHLELVRVPAGEFLMGSDPQVDKQAFPSEQPQDKLSLPDFCIGRYPVTNAQYAAFVKAVRRLAPVHWGGNVSPAGENHPVVNVSWDDAVAFCQWLSATAGREVRLPTEVEWEKAASWDVGASGGAPHKRIYPWGDAFDPQMCNSAESGTRDTTPVGSYSSLGGDSPYGVADMAGNVWEWCLTKWRDDYRRPADDSPMGAAPRVLRGGSFRNDAQHVRCAYRVRSDPLDRFDLIGYRVVSPGF